MTQKGSRSIVVDGVSYRWMVRPKPTYIQEVFACPMTFAVVLKHVKLSPQPEPCPLPQLLWQKPYAWPYSKGWQAQHAEPSFELCLILDSELLMKA